MNHITTYVEDLHLTLDKIPLSLIQQMIDILLTARMGGKQVFVMGNGGSASTASHFAADLAKNTRIIGLPHFRVIALTDNVASITAYANDEGYENVFCQQLAGLINPGDVVVGISASGKSANVLKAIELANAARATTIGLTGFSGGLLGTMVDLHINVPSNRIEQVEDIHLMIDHMVLSAIKDTTQSEAFKAQMIELFGKNEGQTERRSAGTEVASRPIRTTYELLDAINEIMSLHDGSYDLLHHILQLTVDSLGASSGSFLVVDESSNITHGLLAYGGEIKESIKRELLDVFRCGLAGWVVRNRQVALVADTREDPRWLPRDWDEDRGSRSAISVPLIAQNRVAGVLTVARHNAEAFSEEDVTLLTTVAVFLTYRIFSAVRP